MEIDNKFLIVGENPDWDVVERYYENSQGIYFFDIRDEKKFKEKFKFTGFTTTISVEGKLKEIEKRAYSLSKEFVEAICREEDAYYRGVDLLKLAQRFLSSSFFYHLLRSEEEAKSILESLPSGSRVYLVSLKELQSIIFTKIALKIGISISQVSRGESTAKRFKSLARFFNSFFQIIFENFNFYLTHFFKKRVRRENRKRNPSDKVVAFYPSARVHEKIVRKTLKRLRESGFKIAVVDLTAEGELENCDNCDFYFTFKDYYCIRPLSKIILYFFQRFVRGKYRKAVNDFLSRVGLEEFKRRLEKELCMFISLKAPAVIDSHLRVLKAISPSTALVLDERNFRIESLGLLAERLNISTVNVQHGIIHDTPLWSRFPYSKFCVFGEAYKNILVKHGTEERKIEVTGDPRLDEPLKRKYPNREETLAKLLKDKDISVSKDDVLILFAAQYSERRFSDTLLYKTLKSLLEAISPYENVGLIIKLHPLGEGREEGYFEALKEVKGVKAILVRKFDLYELLSLVDLVALHTSTVGFEAIALGKKVFVINLTGGPDEAPYALEKVGIGAYSSQEVKEKIEKFMRGEYSDFPSQSDYDSFIRKYFYKLDGEASNRIAEVIKRVAK
jgi:hypothetical protein